MVAKFESRIIRLGELLRVALPTELIKDINLTDKTPVTIFVNEKGNIEIEILRDGSATSMCAICGKKESKRKCLNCGRLVCVGCFWMFGSLCKKCAKKV